MAQLPARQPAASWYLLWLSDAGKQSELIWETHLVAPSRPPGVRTSTPLPPRQPRPPRASAVHSFTESYKLPTNAAATDKKTADMECVQV